LYCFNFDRSAAAAMVAIIPSPVQSKSDKVAFKSSSTSSRPVIRTTPLTSIFFALTRSSAATERLPSDRRSTSTS